jgi:excisionase family DNA binding protein
MAIDTRLNEYEKYHTVKDISKMLKIHEETVRRAIPDGRLDSVKFGRDYRVKHESFIKFLEKRHFRAESNSSATAKKGSFEALSKTFGTWKGDDAEDIAKSIK